MRTIGKEIKTNDYIVRASAADNYIRAFACTTRGVTEYARKAHNLSPVASAALGRTMAAGLMMGTMMKNEKDLLTIQFKGDGPLGGITVTAGPDGTVKGYVTNPEVVLPPNMFGHFDVGGAVGKGSLIVIQDIGLKEPYVGQVDIQTGEIAEDLAYYYYLSEQVPSIVALGVLMNKDNTVRESLEEKMNFIPAVTELLRDGKSPEQILEQILGEMKLEIYGQMPAQFKCNCSRERVEKALIALGRAELSNIIADGKPETLNCSFCNTNYTFTVDEMREILAKCTH